LHQLYFFGSKEREKAKNIMKYIGIKIKIINKIIIYFVLILFSIINGYPIIWMVFNSFKTQSDMFSNIWGFPKKIVFENYIDAWKRANFQIYFKNSVIVTILSILLILILAILSSYAFSRMKFPGIKILYAIIITTTIIQPQIIMLPTYRLVSQLKMMDSYLALMLTYAADGLPLAILILTAYFRSIPSALIEAATVDGCNRWGVLFKVILPLSGPAIAAVVIFDFVFYWNELVLALVLLKPENLRTITVGLTTFIGGVYRNYSSLFAALSIATIPVVVIYMIFQKNMISGIMSGAIKE
jgi:raffinose/stachyose/melibiose transport system permease protein